MATSKHIYVEDPPIARALFSDVRLSWIWLILRVYLGYQWISASLHKLADPGWMETGVSLKGYWTGAVAITNGKGPITYGWYRDFLNSLLASNSYTWFGKLVAIGEFAIGLMLIIGAFVGIAATFGAFMNLNFMLAGTASTNPELFLIGMLLILAWKTAGYWGLDRWLLPALGTPWQFGEIAGGHRSSPIGGDPRAADG